MICRLATQELLLHYLRDSVSSSRCLSVCVWPCLPSITNSPGLRSPHPRGNAPRRDAADSWAPALRREARQAASGDLSVLGSWGRVLRIYASVVPVLRVSCFLGFMAPKTKQAACAVAAPVPPPPPFGVKRPSFLAASASALSGSAGSGDFRE